MPKSSEPKVDGKTRVKEHIAELTVRGELGGDDDDDAGNTSVNTLNSLRSNSSTKNKISKKEKRAQQVSWKKRRRQAEAIERAENLKEMLSKKVENSVSKLKTINERRKPWDEYNKNVIAPLTPGATKKKSTNAFDLLAADDEPAENEGMDVSD